MTATAQAPADLYATVDLEFRQTDDDRGRTVRLHHVEFARINATGEILRVTIDHKLAQTDSAAVVDLLNRNRDWTRIASSSSATWSDYRPRTNGAGSSKETNRANIAVVAQGLLAKASKILSAA